MAGPVIRLGDETSHGGTVIEASAMSDSGGIGIARMGGRNGCGATLIEGQQNTIDQI